MIGHNTPPAAIQATFSDWRTVKSRKALQLILEVPIEQTEAVLTALGAPMPDQPKWVAVALLQEPEEDEQPKPEGPRRRWHEMPASQQAGILCADPQFHQWVAQALFPTAIGFKPHVKADVKCAEWVREQCGVISRSELDTDPEARAKWDALVSQFRQDTGREPERR